MRYFSVRNNWISQLQTQTAKFRGLDSENHGIARRVQRSFSLYDLGNKFATLGWEEIL